MGSSLGMTNTLWIVIAAVIVIVVALVLLTIFGRGIAPIQTLAGFKQQCQTSASLSCQTTGYLPLTWESEVVIDQKKTSCALQLSEVTCATYGVQDETTTP